MLPMPVAKFQPVADPNAGLYELLVVERAPLPPLANPPRPPFTVVDPKQSCAPPQFTSMSPSVTLWKMQPAASPAEESQVLDGF
jgi:hypothetical protein